MNELLDRDAGSILSELHAVPPAAAAPLLADLEQRLGVSIGRSDAKERDVVDRLTTVLIDLRGDLVRESSIRVLGDSCFYYDRIGRSFDGISRGVAAKAMAEARGLVNLERLAGNALAVAYIGGCCYEEACRTLERSLHLARELDDPLYECLAMTNTAALLKEMGLYRDAIEVIDRALAFDLASPRGRYLALGNAITGLFSAHRLRDDAAALRYLRIGSEALDDSPLSDVLQKASFEYCRALYLLFAHDNETAELLVGAAKRRVEGVDHPRVHVMLDIATALCDWASRDPAREKRARKDLAELYHRTKVLRRHHDDVLRALMDVYGRTMTGETELGSEQGIDALQRLIAETAKKGMHYAKELVDYTAGGDPSTELVEFTTGVKRAKFYRQLCDREAARRPPPESTSSSPFDPFAGVRGWLSDGVRPAPSSPTPERAAPAHAIRTHDELNAIHGDLARFRAASLKASMRTDAYDVAENWALAAEFFDDQTGQHCFRVGRLAGLLAAELDLGAEDCVRIEHAARLHDIGKIAVNEMILLKPGPLDASEITAMRAHTVIGAQLLDGTNDPTLQMAASIARYHHAWWNGSGYPATFGDAIPLVARICAYADVYDALTNERPYKRAWSHRRAVEQMVSENGEHFDPSLMRPFLRVLERHVGSTSEPPSTRMHLEDMEANGLLTSRRKLMEALKRA